MNDLVFNENKTKVMTFGNKRERLLSLPSIDTADSVKHLGVIIDETLSWNDHIDSVCQKLSSELYLIKRTISISSVEAARSAYFALFERKKSIWLGCLRRILF